MYREKGDCKKDDINIMQEEIQDNLPINLVLRKWFENQNKWKTYKELAKDINVPYNTLKKYFYINNARVPNEQNRRIFYEITELECFKTRIEIFSEKLEALMAEMEYFYYGRKKDRETLRKILRNKIQKFHLLVRALSSEKSREMVIKEGGLSDGSKNK